MAGEMRARYFCANAQYLFFGVGHGRQLIRGGIVNAAAICGVCARFYLEEWRFK